MSSCLQDGNGIKRISCAEWSTEPCKSIQTLLNRTNVSCALLKPGLLWKNDMKTKCLKV